MTNKLKKIAADFERRADQSDQRLKGIEGLPSGGWKSATIHASARDTWRKAAKLLRKKGKQK